MNALEIRGLRKEYPGFCLDIEALDLPMGCVMGLVGENGAGKTTTMKLILNMIRPAGGTVAVLGHDSAADLDAVKADLGVVLGDAGIPEITAVQLGKVMARAYEGWEDARYESLLKTLKVPEKKVFSKLSQGMKMKLSIAAAMSHGAKLLILDEATNGLDPVARDEVTDMLWEFTRNAGHSVLISSHIVSDLEKICDYIAFLHEGKVLLCEEKDVLLAEHGMLRCPAARLDELAPEAILARRDTPYGAEAVVRRDGVPAGTKLQPVSLEDIFVAMIRGNEG